MCLATASKMAPRGLREAPGSQKSWKHKIYIVFSTIVRSFFLLQHMFGCCCPLLSLRFDVFFGTCFQVWIPSWHQDLWEAPGPPKALHIANHTRCLCNFFIHLCGRWRSQRKSLQSTSPRDLGAKPWEGEDAQTIPSTPQASSMNYLKW